jgi:hypothetical protein
VNATCCYCNTAQEVPAPPALASCIACKRDFRVYYNFSGAKLELGQDAKRFFELKPKVAI